MKVAIYVRVSTNKQEVENQLLQLRSYVSKCGDLIQDTYIDIVSGEKSSRPHYDRMYKDAHLRLFDKILFWDLSRFSRSGTLFTLQKLKELDNLEIQWESYQEPYIRSAGQFKDVVISILASLAKVEREKISERTKAGLERARAKGVKVGRQKGSKDKKPRKKSGYYLRHEREKLLSEQQQNANMGNE